MVLTVAIVAAAPSVTATGWPEVEAARLLKLFEVLVRAIGEVRAPKSSSPKAVIGCVWLRPAAVMLRLLEAETLAPAVEIAEGTAVVTDPIAKAPAFLKLNAMPEVATARVAMLFAFGNVKAIVETPDRT